MSDSNIQALEQKYGNFYAPAFTISISGQDIVKDKQIEIVSVSVDSTLYGASSFTFTVNNAFDIINTKVQWLDYFKFGNQVTIKMGYANSTSDLPLVILGLITSIKMNFPSEGTPQMEVSGFDLSFKLMKERKTRPPDSNKRYSDIAKSIVDDNQADSDPTQDYLKYPLNYNYDVIPFNNPAIEDSDDNQYPQIVKNIGESDFDFLTRLAQRISYDFFVFNHTLYFRKPTIQNEAVVTLEWGKSLVSFSPELDISGMVKGIAVTSHNTDQNVDIVGIATNKTLEDSDSGSTTVGVLTKEDVTELLSEVLGTSAKEDQKLRVDVVLDIVSSETDAMNLAKALLKKKNESYLKGTGESIGIPEILAGKNIQLNGLGTRFSQLYYIEKANHSISSSGYKTIFSVKYMGLNTDDNIELKSGTKSTHPSGNGGKGGKGGEGSR